MRLPEGRESCLMSGLMSEEILWFYEGGGERRGPVGVAALVALYQRGEIAATTLVWRDGLDDWIAFSASGLAPAANAGSGPPPVPLLAPATPPPVPAGFLFQARAVSLRPDFRPSINACYGRAWDLLKTRFWPFVGCFALVTLILGVAYQFYLPAFFLMFPLLGGLYWYILRAARGETVQFEMLFEGFRRQFGPLAIANLIVSGIGIGMFLVIAVVFGLAAAAIGAGTSLFESDDPLVIAGLVGGGLFALFVMMIPLMVLGVVANFAILLILDGEVKAGEALSLGWAATKPHLFKLLFFMIVNGFLSFAGMLALYFGVFITGAWASIALVYLYEDAFGDGKRPV